MGVALGPTTSLAFATCELRKSYLWKQKLVSRGASTIVQSCNSVAIAIVRGVI